MTDDELPDRLEGAPPSARFCYRELEHAERPLSHTDLQVRTYLHKNTLSEALSTLLELDAVERVRSDDLRERRYRLRER